MKQIYVLAKNVFAVRPDKVEKTVLKGGADSGGGASVVHLDRGFADSIFEQMREYEDFEIDVKNSP